MFGTREPKPVVLSDEGISKFRVMSKDVSASHLRRYLSAVVGSRNRFTSQDKMMQVENYIHENFATHGWTVERQKYRFKTFDGLKSDGHGHVHMKYHDLEGVNIIATKPGKNINQIVVIGAHYDTIDNTPGADDNGSGIAALLELARVLGKYSYSKTLVLVAFDMEEIGFAGSKA
ncbi:MAG: M28 family peptidase, partial [Thermoplasmata archaeon]